MRRPIPRLSWPNQSASSQLCIHSGMWTIWPGPDPRKGQYRHASLTISVLSYAMNIFDLHCLIINRTRVNVFFSDLFSPIFAIPQPLTLGWMTLKAKSEKLNIKRACKVRYTRFSGYCINAVVFKLYHGQHPSFVFYFCIYYISKYHQQLVKTKS